MLKNSPSGPGWRRPAERWLGALLGAVLAVAPVRAEVPPEVMLVLDGSAGMWERISGQPKIAATQAVLSAVLPAFPFGVNMGLVAYGHRFRGDCADSETLLAPGSDDRRALIERVRGVKPAGMAPLAYALQPLIRDLQARPARTTVIVIGAGPDNCGADPCARVRELKAAGARFELHVIGLGIAAQQQAALSCLAEAGGGRYFSANSIGALRDALEAIRSRLAPAGVEIQDAAASQKLGRLALTLPADAVASLTSLTIVRQRDQQVVRSYSDLKAENVYSLPADEYRLILDFSNPRYLPSVEPARPIPLTVGGGGTAALALGAVAFKVAAALRNRVTEAVILRDADSGAVFISITGPDDEYLFKTKPVPAGRYAVVLKLVGSPTLLTLIPSLEVTAGREAVVSLDTGFRLKPLPGVGLSGWSLYQAGTDSPVLQVNLLQSGGRNYPLFRVFPITPGRYDLRLHFKKPDRTVLQGKDMVIEPGKIVQLEAGR